MFIKKSKFEELEKLCESQQQQIDNLNEKLGILALALGQQFQFDLGTGWKLTAIKPEHQQFVAARRDK